MDTFQDTLKHGPLDKHDTSLSQTPCLCMLQPQDISSTRTLSPAPKVSGLKVPLYVHVMVMVVLLQEVEEGAGVPHMVGFYDPRHRDRNNVTDLGNSGEKTGCGNGEDTQQCMQLVEGVNLAGESELTELHNEEEEEEEDDEGWITPENFQQVCEEMGGVTEELPQSLAVGCITTDFAMQVCMKL